MDKVVSKRLGASQDENARAVFVFPLPAIARQGLLSVQCPAFALQRLSCIFTSRRANYDATGLAINIQL